MPRRPPAAQREQAATPAAQPLPAQSPAIPAPASASTRLDVAVVTFAPVLRTLIRCAAGVWIFSYLVPIAQALAGKETKASVLLQFITNLPVRDIISLAFGVGGIGWGARERHLRKRRVAQLADENTELESALDPNRSSSGLTRMGEGPRVP